MTVNAGGLSEGVFESELFGHVKGAFTDAKTDRVGRFELAEGGTLFLDEIANISLNLQAKLLRVLETGEFERVGSSRTRRANVRIISATNADLNAEVAAGRFRQDLLFRLNTIEIPMPPLRERREDIPLLARHFLLQHAQRYRKRLTGFDQAAMQVLLDHAWPGNVRELDHAVERAVLMAQGEQIAGRDLGLRASRDAAGKLEDMSLEEVEGFLIKKALARYGRQCQPGGQGAGPQPQRAVPEAPALRTVTSAGRSPAVPAHARPFTPCEMQVHAVKSPRRSFDNWLTHDRRVVMMALGAGLPGIVIALVLLWCGDFSSRVQWTLTLLVVGLWWGVAFALRDRVDLSPADDLEPAGGVARGGLLHPGARVSARHDPLGRSADRDERAGRHAAGAAHGRARSERTAARGDGGDSRRGVRVRSGPAAAPRQPRGRAAAGAARRSG